MSLEPAPPLPSSTATPRTSPAAVWSLVLGILSISCLWILGSIPAIILGIIGMRKVDASPETVSGRGLALSGIITGGAGILLGLIPVAMVASIAMPAFIGVRDKTIEAKQVSELRMISLACRSFAVDNEGLFPDKLIELAPDYLDEMTLVYEDPDDINSTVPYLYRPGLSDSSNMNEPFLLGPEGRRGRRAVGYVSGVVAVEQEPIDPSLLEEFE